MKIPSVSFRLYRLSKASEGFAFLNNDDAHTTINFQVSLSLSWHSDELSNVSRDDANLRRL